jgi:hypothetical protein
MGAVSPASKDQAIQSIVSDLSDVMSLVLRADPKGASVSPEQFRKQFSGNLKTSFSQRELDQIDGTLKKVGGKNLTQMTQVLVQTIARVALAGDSLPDISLNLSPRYESVLEKVFEEKNGKERLKKLYLSLIARDKSDNAEAKAEKYVLIAKKHIKKAISDQFSEEQYCSYFEFEHSDLGRRLQYTLQQSIL